MAIETDEQRRWWFAHLDAQGYRKPKGPNAQTMRVYHGSPHRFEEFDLSKAGTTTDEGQLGKGLYFSTDVRVASGYAHQYEVDVELENPFVLQNKSWDWRTKKRDLAKALGVSESSSASELANELKRRGHDSVILDNSPIGYMHQEVVVFGDKQARIRSVRSKAQ